MICDMGYKGYKSHYYILPHFIKGRPDDKKNCLKKQKKGACG